MSHIDLPESDDQLMTALSAVLRSDVSAPDAVRAAARGAFAWRSVDAELAVLANDSHLTALAGVRGGGDRQLTFEGATVTLEVDVVEEDGGGERQLIGQVVPPQPGRIDVEGPAVRHSQTTDGYGQFALAVPASAGPARLRFVPAGPPVRSGVVTDWITL